MDFAAQFLDRTARPASAKLRQAFVIRNFAQWACNGSRCGIDELGRLQTKHQASSSASWQPNALQGGHLGTCITSQAAVTLFPNASTHQWKHSRIHLRGLLQKYCSCAGGAGVHAHMLACSVRSDIEITFYTIRVCLGTQTADTSDSSR